MELITTPTAVNRRTTRSALAEIPARMGGLAVAENAPTPTQTRVAETPGVNGGGILAVTNRTSADSATSPSPEELVIQQRGRRRLPVTWSPDIDATKRQGPQCRDRTPVKGGALRESPVKPGIVLRSTPRKRLQMCDPKEMAATPEKQGRRSGSPAKKARPERNSAPLAPYSPLPIAATPPAAPPASTAAVTPFAAALKGLSQDQLIRVVQDLLSKHPFLEEEVIEALPTPDMKPLEERLKYLKKNIFKSLPNSRLTSKTDSPAFSRAATHLMDFKKCVIEQGRCLVDSQHWGSALDYVLLAWDYVKATPLWDNPPHNTARKQCFRSLTAMAVTALRKGSWTVDQLASMKRRFHGCDSESDDIQTCLKQIDSMLRK